MYKCHCGQKYSDEITLNEHKKICRIRSHSCILCDEQVLSSDMANHLLACGNKTTRCPNCQKHIRRDIYNYHVENSCIDPNYEDDADDHYLMPRKQQNDAEVRDTIFIPCEFCHEPIESTRYHSHATHCMQSSWTPHYSRSIRDSSAREQERYPRSSADGRFGSNDVNLSIAEELKPTNTSLERLSLNSDSTSLTNTSRDNKSISRKSAVSLLHSKTDDVQGALAKDYYPTEVNHLVEKLQFNIVLTGPPRVGKSQLINALCDGENRAETSSSLNSCTQKVQCYTLEDNQQRTPGVKPFKINFYDTPGIESWNNQDGQRTMEQFLEETNPVCLIFCAAPGSHAQLEQLRPILELCKTKQIFCALVCTNMWANSSRKVVIEEFQKELQTFGEQRERLFDQGSGRSKHAVTMFGHGALCTMVNSVEYFDPELSPVRMPVQGIDELIHCIMEELDQEKLLGWCNAVLYRRSYWEKIRQKVDGFYSTHAPDMHHLLAVSKEQVAVHFAAHFFSIIRKRQE